MNRRSFLRAFGATGLALAWRSLAAEEGSAEAGCSELLRRALAARRMVEFSYHGHVRRVEPHALGRATEDRPALLGWQAAGGSASEPPPGWRTFLLAEIEQPTLLREKFTPRPDYRPAAARLKSIEAEVQA